MLTRITSSLPNLPRLYIERDALWLTGVTQPPIAIGSLQERCAAATANVAAARAHAAILPVFVGIEHLAALHEWPADRPALLVEPTPDWADLLCTQQQLAVPPQIQLLRGAYGWLHAEVPTPVQQIIISHDLVTLLGQLQRTLSPLLARYPEYRLYTAGTDPYGHFFFSALTQCLPLIPQILQFHAQCAPLCHALRATPKQDHLLVVGLEDEEQSMSVLTRHLAHRTSWVPLCTPGADDRTPIQFPDGTRIAPLHHPTLTAASGSYLRLLRALHTTNAAWVLCRNMSIFQTEDELNLLGPLLTATGTTLLAGMTDWFTQIAHNFHGGLCFLPACDLLPREQLRVCTMYPGYSRCYNPAQRPLTLLPYGYLADTPAQQPPLPARADCPVEVLVVHSRRRTTTLSPIEQEWFDGIRQLADRYPAAPRDQLAHRLLLGLRQRLPELPPPLGTDACQLMLNTLDFAHYVDSRHHALCAIIPMLAEQFRVRVVGNGWEQDLSPALCAPNISDRALLDRAYRHAGVTLFFSSMYEGGVAPPEAVRCLASGGYPIIATPTIDPRPDTSPWPGIHAGDFATFARLADLPAQIAAVMQNWTDRNWHIASVQQRWEQTLMHTGQFSIPDLLANPLPSDTMPMTTFTGDVAVDRALLTASLGYLALFMGFPQRALEYWQHEQSLAQLDIPAWTTRAAQFTATR